MKNTLSTLFKDFTDSERNAGLVLLFCTVVSLIAANVSSGENYIHFWHKDAGIPALNIQYSIIHWINDGLMTIFFLLVGLEIERELYAGELHPLKNALLPLCGALGGMLMPALIFIAFNFNSATVSGFGIPMGTDIAFALGILSLGGNKVPVIIKIILTAIAIIDDLGSILIIAIFYGSGIHYGFLIAALGIFGLLLLLNRLKVHNIFLYLLLGISMWFFMMKSGIHPAIAGVLLAFAIPFAGGENNSPSIKLQKYLHVPVAFIILPLFTLANMAIPVKTEFINSLTDPHALGIGLALIIGKPLGIVLSFFILIKIKIVKMPAGVSWFDFIALGCIAGIGFTMSVFITQLAFTTEFLVQSSKLAILLASCIAGTTGLLLFYFKRKTIN